MFTEILRTWRALAAPNYPWLRSHGSLILLHPRKVILPSWAIMTTEWSGKMQPINYSRGRRGRSLAWNWARSYQSAGASEGDICLWDSLTLSASLCLSFSSFTFQACLVSPIPSSFHSFCSACACHWTICPCLRFLFAPLISISALSLSFFFNITLPLNILCLSLCASPLPPYTLFHGSPSPLFMHSLASFVFQHLSNFHSLSPSVLSSLSFYALLHHLLPQWYVLVYLLSNQQDRIKPWCTFPQCDASMIWMIIPKSKGKKSAVWGKWK